MTAFTSLTAPPAIREFTTPPGLFSRQPRGASTNFFPLGLLAQRQGSDLAEHPDPSAPRTDLMVLGVFKANAVFTSGSSTDSSGGALDTNGNPQSLSIETGTIGWFDTGAGAHQITNSMVGLRCYLYDNNTLYADDLNGTLSPAGFVAQVRADGKVKLRIDPAVYLFSSGNNPPGVTSDDTVRAVATSLPAGTFSGGVLTLTATGAFSTAQDGVTLAVGDKFIIPAGTITTLVVSAANSGVYEVTSLGATGVSAKFTRSARWAHGAIITPETEIRVGGEGTLFKGTRWYADPATATKVVGTDDPVLYPRSVTQTVTLSSSAKAITNVPIKAAGSQVLCRLSAVGGTTTSTVSYGTLVDPTPGGIGTATTTVNALASGMTKNGTSDTSNVVVTIFN